LLDKNSLVADMVVEEDGEKKIKCRWRRRLFNGRRKL
jgi:hypothetical protein